MLGDALVSDQKANIKAINDFFKKRYSKPPTAPIFISHLNFSKLSHADATILVKPFTQE